MTADRWLLRVAASISMALWVVSLFARVDSYRAYSPPGYNYGWWMLVMGWLGPFGFNFAWFGNFLLFMFWYKFFVGRTLGMPATLITLVLILSALCPFFIFDFVYDGRFHPEFFRGPAVWLWLLSFAPVLAITVLRRLSQSN
jgi:hypothetical protein